MNRKNEAQKGLSRRRLLALAGVASVTALAACAPKPGLSQAPATASTSSNASQPAATSAQSTSGTTELVYWTFMPTQTRFPGRPQLFADFEQKNKAKVTITDVDFATMSEKFLASAAAKGLCINKCLKLRQNWEGWCSSNRRGTHRGEGGSEPIHRPRPCARQGKRCGPTRNGR